MSLLSDGLEMWAEVFSPKWPIAWAINIAHGGGTRLTWDRRCKGQFVTEILNRYGIAHWMPGIIPSRLDESKGNQYIWVPRNMAAYAWDVLHKDGIPLTCAKPPKAQEKPARARRQRQPRQRRANLLDSLVDKIMR